MALVRIIALLTVIAAIAFSERTPKNNINEGVINKKTQTSSVSQSSDPYIVDDSNMVPVSSDQSVLVNSTVLASNSSAKY